jgi:hypothetical protein
MAQRLAIAPATVASSGPFAHRYARAYRDGSPQRPRQADSWLVVHAAPRLAEGIEVEQATLIGFLDHAHQKATR